MSNTIIMIAVHDGNTAAVHYATTNKFNMDVIGCLDDAMFINVPMGGCGFSLNELKETVQAVSSDADVYIGDLLADGTIEPYIDIPSR